MRPEHIIEGVTLFAENELLPALEGWRVWVASAAVAAFHRKSAAVVPKLTQNKLLAMLDVVDESGEIDVDTAVEALKETARKYGKLPLDIPILDIEYNFTEKDIETLRGYINQAAGVTSSGG